MKEIKFWMNRHDKGMRGLADQLRDVGIDFASLSTSGPTVLYIGDEPHCGPVEIKRVVEILTRTTTEGA